MKKFLPTFLIGLLICFNYALLRVLKDTVVVNASDAGAAVIPFLKMWGVLPAALIATLLMSRLFRTLSRHQVFYLGVGAFILYFILFGTVFYPLRETLAPNQLADYLRLRLPSGFAAPIEVIRHWPLSLFYVMCELWKVVVLLLIFWGFVNASSSLDEAKRVYAPLMIGGSLAGILAGYLTTFSQNHEWESVFSLFLAIAIAVGFIVLALYAYVQRHVTFKQLPEKQPKSVMGAFRMVTKSPLLLCMSLFIIFDYIAFNLVEVLWKEELRTLYHNKALYCAYTGKVAMWTGVLGIIGILLTSTKMIRKSGWTVIAIATPVILLATSGSFFAFLMMGGAGAAVLSGAIHNCLCRASRQALFDPAKEIAYVHLPPTLATQGKTFVDGMSPTLGKSSGALITQSLLLSSPTIIGIAGASAGIVLASLLIAFAATVRAGSLLKSRAVTT